MKQLEMFKEPSVHDIVREYFVGCGDELAHAVLINCTGWPDFFATTKQKTKEDCLREQLIKIFLRSGGNPELAIAIAEADAAREMRYYSRGHDGYIVIKYTI